MGKRGKVLVPTVKENGGPIFIEIMCSLDIFSEVGWKHRYRTLNRDRKRHHAPCILPVQLTSLVGNEAGFAQNRFERPENWSNSFNIVCYCVALRSLKVL